MKIIIAGSRDFTDYKYVANILDSVYKSLGANPRNTEVVSGVCKGVDKLGERWAKERWFKIKRFPAKWSEHGNVAGPIRNQEMIDYVIRDNSILIAFLSADSKGTKDIIKKAKKCGVPVRVIMI